MKERRWIGRYKKSFRKLPASFYYRCEPNLSLPPPLNLSLSTFFFLLMIQSGWDRKEILLQLLFISIWPWQDRCNLFIWDGRRKVVRSVQLAKKSCWIKVVREGLKNIMGRPIFMDVRAWVCIRDYSTHLQRAKDLNCKIVNEKSCWVFSNKLLSRFWIELNFKFKSFVSLF